MADIKQTIKVKQKGGKFAKGAGFLSFVWNHRYIILTIIIFLPQFILAIQEAKATSNYFLPVLSFGGLFLNADYQLDKHVNTFVMESNQPMSFSFDDLKGTISSLWHKISLYWSIFEALWFMFISLKFFSWIFSVTWFSETDKVFANWTGALFIMVLIMVFTSSVLLIKDVQTEEKILPNPNENFLDWTKEIGKEVVPFQGVANFITHIPQIMAGLPLPEKDNDAIDYLKGNDNNLNVTTP